MSAAAKNNGPTVLNPGEPVQLGPVKLVKVIQTESGPFTTSNNLASIEFDGENVTDLKRSYLDLHVRFQTFGGEPGTDVQLGDMATDARYMGSSFFKTVTLKSENVGMVEQMRYQNVHSETMKQFVKYSQEEDSANVLNNGGSVKVDANGEAHIIVPLKDILPGCGNSDLPYPNSRMGPSILELELENVKPLAYSQADGIECTYEIACNDIASQEAIWELTQVICTQPFASQEDAEQFFMIGVTNPTLTYTAGEPQNVEVVITNVTVNPDTFVTTLTIESADGEPIEIPANEDVENVSIERNIEESYAGNDINGAADADTDVNVITFQTTTDNFVIGTTLYVAYLQQTAAGLEDNDAYHVANMVIADVNPNATNAEFSDVTFEDTIFTIPAGFNATQIESFVELEPGQLQWSISEIDLILVKPVKPFEVPVYEIMPMNLEMVNLPADVPFFRRQFELESSCSLVQLLNPTSSLISVKQFGAYRNALNSVQTTTQDVEVDLTNNGSLYFDRWLTAMDEVKRLQFRNGQLEVAAIVEAVTPQVIGLPNNVLEFQLMDPVVGGVQSSMLYCYKRIMRSF
jgi:hypothetical protein